MATPWPRDVYRDEDYPEGFDSDPSFPGFVHISRFSTEDVHLVEDVEDDRFVGRFFAAREAQAYVPPQQISEEDARKIAQEHTED